jgi:glutamine amidotransferase
MIAIIDYNAGNVKSVQFALERLGVEALVTADADQIRAADKVIFPGVGEASSTMGNLRKTGLDKLIPTLKQPVLGICLGMQLMCAFSEEGNVDCLGIFPERVRKFPVDQQLKVPHVGWNNITDLKSSILQQLDNNEYMYFVHSFYVELGPDTIATTDYVQPFSAALQKDNFYAVQFHPEKSGTAGATILNEFLSL